MWYQLTVLLLPVAATCGWFMGRRERFNKSQPHHAQLQYDYFKGLNFLINEQPDEAVDIFIKLLEVDIDTVETHLALGGLFRRRGEVNRAIRIHQNLIARPKLNQKYRIQALLALGQDYLCAGVLDRAERLFLQLVETGEERQPSLRYLIHIYQQEKEWQKAIDAAKKLQAISGESMRPVIAQYHCELALKSTAQNQPSDAFYHLKRARAVDPGCVRAYIIQADLESTQGDYKEAIRCYQQVIEQDSDYISEVVMPLADCFHRLGEEVRLIEYFQKCLQRHPCISLVLAISDYLQKKEDDKAAIEFIAQEIQRQPSLRGLSRLVDLYISHSTGEAKGKLAILQRYMDLLLADKPVYRCAQCGYAGQTLFWLCPSCHTWMAVKPIQGLEGN